MGVESRILAGGAGKLVEQHLDALRASCHGPQRIQRADIARALPDAHQRRLPVQPRHSGVLGITVAPEAFHGLAGVRCGALAHPVFGGGQTDTPQQCLALVATGGGVGGTGHSHRDDGGGLGFDGKIGEHVAHQWLVDQVGAEGLAVRSVVDGTGKALPHAGGAAQRAVQAGEIDHLDDGRYTAALFADKPGEGTVVFDLTGGVGVITELVLQALQKHSVAGSVRKHPRHQEATEPGRGLGEHQKHITHRSRGEPLVPGQRVTAVGIADRRGGSGTHIGSTLLLGHRHARGDTHLGGRHLQFGVVGATGQQRLVGMSEFGVVPQGGYHGVGHRDRTDMSGFGCPDAHLGRTHDMGSRSVVGPGRGVQAVADRDAHEFVVGGVVLDLIDAIPVAVMGMQHRPVAIGEITPALGGGSAGDRPELADLIEAPLPTLADQRLDEHRRGGGVPVDQGRHLIGDKVGVRHSPLLHFLPQSHKIRNRPAPG